MQRLDRREWLTSLIAACGGVLAFGWSDAEGGQRGRARVRRRVRRRVRCRIRRRAMVRVVNGRRLWVVPVALAVGWELDYEERIVVVKELKNVERNGTKLQVAVVQDSAGKTEEVEILREDTDENRKDLEGSVLPDSDKTTPGVEGEIEEEVDN